MIRVLPFVALAACSPVLEMPAPVAYPGACPEDDWKCQRNADAQTLRYIGADAAAIRLMCQDLSLAPLIGEQCDTLPVVY
jgi:hypothetical protein